MKWFQNLAFRYKLILPLGLITCLFILFAWSTLHRVDALGMEVANLVRTDVPVVENLLQADPDLYQALVAERTLIFIDVSSPAYGEMTAQHAENVKQAHDRIDRAAAMLAASHLGMAPDIADKLKLFSASHHRWETLSNRVVQERSSDTRAGRSTAISLTLREASDAFEQMRAVLDELEDIVIDMSQHAAERAETAVAASRLQTLILLAVGLGILALVIFGLPPLILGPLRSILNRLQDIADGEGELNARL